MAKLKKLQKTLKAVRKELAETQGLLIKASADAFRYRGEAAVREVDVAGAHRGNRRLKAEVARLGTFVTEHQAWPDYRDAKEKALKKVKVAAKRKWLKSHPELAEELRRKKAE